VLVKHRIKSVIAPIGVWKKGIKLGKRFPVDKNHVIHEIVFQLFTKEMILVGLIIVVDLYLSIIFRMILNKRGYASWN
jgi:uncharacterized RDD family membrane protein YckC